MRNAKKSTNRDFKLVKVSREDRQRYAEQQADEHEPTQSEVADEAMENEVRSCPASRICGNLGIAVQ